MKKETSRFEIELTRHNVTPAQFLAYVRSRVDAKGGKYIRSDLDLDYFKRGNDLNFDTKHEDADDPCHGIHEKSISRPYEMQTYIRYESGAVYNEICEFSFDDDKVGTGYYYLVNVMVDEQSEAEAAEDAAPAEAVEYINGDHKLTVEEVNGDTVRLSWFEMMGGRWVALGEPEIWSKDAAAEEIESFTAVENEDGTGEGEKAPAQVEAETETTETTEDSTETISAETAAEWTAATKTAEGMTLEALYTPDVCQRVTLCIDGNHGSESEKRIYEAIQSGHPSILFDLLTRYAETHGIKWGGIWGCEARHYDHGKTGRGHYIVTGYISGRIGEEMSFCANCADLLRQHQEEHKATA